MLRATPPTQEFFWDDLLEYIEEGRVIPVVGAELLTIPDGSGGEIAFQTLVARRLADRLQVKLNGSPDEKVLNEVVCHYLENGGRREEIYPRLRSVVKELAPPVPEPLRQLARIREFNLFVTTTFDSLLARALDEERFGGAQKTVSLAYAPNHTQDLTADFLRSATATVFHLLGRMSASPDYVITEEDTLEFFTSMQTESKRPNVLLDELKSSHLLLIGNTFPDWLTRFFIRIAKCGRLSAQRSELEIIADRRSHEDRNLVLFLKNFSYRTQIFEQGNAVDFVRELSARYLERHPEALSGGAARPVDASEMSATEPESAVGTRRSIPEQNMRAGAVFLSYASQDVAAVQKIRDALDAAGIDVWFDKRHLEGGDDFDLEIKKYIRGCSYFVPVISKNTEARHEAYFRLEWNMAAERAKLIAETVPFILPVSIDSIVADSALVPERFRQVQWTPLGREGPSAEFVEKMVRLIRDFRKRERGLA